MNRIAIFAKSPVPGHAKTRLASLLGLEGAAEFARRMLVDTCREAGQVTGATVELCIAPAPDQPLWAGPLPEGVDLVSAQGDGDLGMRLSRAAERSLSNGERIVLIGTDCPELNRGRIQSACTALDRHDAFIHPVEDGGYALLALRRYAPSLFSGIVWSGPAVADATVARLQALDWSYGIGEMLRDIDEPADFEAVFGRRTLDPE